ncbi:MAG TPA: hypothetical protein VG714_05625 [Acidobacteriaceae bacterium]|nr:hypothetical protein [Acidobacteriaceae bacterium]
MSTPAPPPFPQAAPPVSPYGAAPPQSGGGALKVILIVIAVAIGLGILGVGMLGFMGYRAFHKASATFAAGTGAGVSDDELGISIYPGSVRVDNGSMRVKIGTHAMTTAAYTTSDPASSVISFYKDKLGDGVIVNESAAGTTLQTVESESKGHLLVTVSPDSAGNGTRIVIVHEEGSGS